MQQQYKRRAEKSSPQLTEHDITIKFKQSMNPLFSLI